MADITTNHLTNGTASGGSGSATTASISPSNTKVYTVKVRGRASSGTPNTPTISGCGLTWTLEEEIKVGTSGAWLFRAVGTPTPGTLTISFAGQAISTIAWSVDEWGNVDRGGTNGSNAFVQSVPHSIGNSSSFNISLAALANAKNVALGFLVQRNTIATLTPGSGQNVIHNQGFDGDDSWLVQHKLNATVSDCTSNQSASPWIGIAAELKYQAPSRGGAFLSIL
jgi:hypothetical protein